MVMASSSDYSLAWLTAEICAMNIEGAVDLAFYREYKAAENPEEKRRELMISFDPNWSHSRSRSIWV